MSFVRHCLCTLLLVGSLLPGAGAAHASDAGNTDDAMDEVVVSGMRSGPRMWRVSHGDHVLWLLGTTRALPKDVTWDTRDIEQVLASSQLLITDVKLDASPGLLSLLPLYLDYRKRIRLPKSETLESWLTPASLARYRLLQQRYAPKENWDGYRPMYVAAQLWRAASRASGLSERVNVQKQVLKLAKQQGVTIQALELEVDKPARTLREVMAELDQLPREREIACFDATMSTLQEDVHLLRASANAWAMGDVDTLRRLRDRVQSACWEALFSSAKIDSLTRQMNERWLAAAQTALGQHSQTLALRDMNFLLGTDGLLNRLRALGYQVQGP